MEKKKSDLTNLSHDKKAQAGSSPELSSVFEEMKNGIDIQPLEDIMPEKFIEFEDRCGNDDNEGFDTKRSKKRIKKIKLLRIAVVALLVCAVALGSYLALFRLDKLSHTAEAIYQKNSAVNVMLENGKTIELGPVKQVKLSDDGKTVVYSQDTSSKTGKYDIRVIDLTRRSSVQNKGSVIVSGTDENWSCTNDGAYVFYVNSANGSTKCYAYDTKTKKTLLISSGVEEIYTPPVGDIVYYTRSISGKEELYRTAIGGEPEFISEISAVRAFKNEEKSEIFFTVKDASVQNDIAYSLYKITAGNTAEKISDGVSEVYLDDYEIGGNLYYFVKNTAKLNWKDFVTDPYDEYDALLQKPDKGDYLVTKGFIFKTTKVDESAYNNALGTYQKKLVRDDIREALNKLDLGLAVSAEYKVRVYDGSASREIANGVKLENLLAFAKTGAPRVIFNKTEIDASKRTDMDKLYSIAAKDGTENAIDYVINSLGKKYETTSGCKYARYDGSKVLEYDFAPGYDVSKATFLFASRDAVFAAVKAEDTSFDLLFSTISDKAITESAKVASDITSFEAYGENVFYMAKSENGNDLYICGKDGKSKAICKNCAQYFIVDGGNVVSFGYSENAQSGAGGNVVLYSGGESKTIDKDVDLRFFVTEKNNFSYIKNYQNAAATDSEATVGGEMKIYSDGKIKNIDSGVTYIYAITSDKQ